MAKFFRSWSLLLKIGIGIIAYIRAIYLVFRNLFIGPSNSYIKYIFTAKFNAEDTPPNKTVCFQLDAINLAEKQKTMSASAVGEIWLAQTWFARLNLDSKRWTSEVRGHDCDS